MDHVADSYVVFLLGYPAVGKRTVGSHLAERLHGVLVDNSLTHIPLLTLFKWDGKFCSRRRSGNALTESGRRFWGPSRIWRRSPTATSSPTTWKDDEDGARRYDRIRSLAHRRGSLFLSVVVDCDVDEAVRRIDNPDRIARLKGSDPEGYRRYRRDTKLFQPPPDEVLHIDTTDIRPEQNAESIYEMLSVRGFRPPSA